MNTIPNNFVNYKSTKVFDVNSVPKLFLHRHNTKAGVYGKIVVLKGKLKFYGFSQRRGDVEQEITLLTGQTAISPPQYWHKVEFLEPKTQFKVDFYAQEDSEIVKQNLCERNTNTL